MKKFLLLSIFFNSGFFISAQNYAADLKKILIDFSQMESYSIKAKVSVTGDESYSFEAWVKNSKYGSHLRTDISEMLINNGVSIAIDHQEKIIRVDWGDYGADKSGKESLGLEGFEELLNKSIKVDYLGKTETYKTYVIYNGAGIEKTVVKINLQNGFFSEIEVFYSDKEISVSSYKITYTEFKKNPDFNKSEFDEKVIIKKMSNGSYVPVEKYKGYHIEIG